MKRARMLFASAALLAVLAPTPAHAALPPIKHVFIIVMENKDYDTTFGPKSQAPYLAKTLVGRGELLSDYYGTGHLSNDNYISMISGQAPNLQNQLDCQNFTDFLPGTAVVDGQAIGQGCVFPTSVKTIADQLTDKHLTWKGYMEDMANSKTGEPKSCRHPAIGDKDDTQGAKPGDQYATRHNPFVYFHSIIDTPACAANDVDLSQLPGDLRSASATANYNFITPNLCSDGHDATCVDGKPGGLVAENAFLQKWVPRIEGSPAYKQDGLLIITYDEAEFGSDSSSCCGEMPGPNTPTPGLNGPGGGKIGAVLLSPFIKPGTKNSTPYNHYSLLRSMEDLFGLDHLGFAGQDGLAAFGSKVFNGSGPSPGRCTAAASGKPIQNATVSHRGGRASLRLRFRRNASLDVRAKRAKGRAKRVGPRRVRACRNYTVGLGKGHGTAAVKARAGSTTQKRTLRY